MLEITEEGKRLPRGRWKVTAGHITLETCRTTSSGRETLDCSGYQDGDTFEVTHDSDDCWAHVEALDPSDTEPFGSARAEIQWVSM